MSHSDPPKKVLIICKIISNTAKSIVIDPPEKKVKISFSDTTQIFNGDEQSDSYMTVDKHDNQNKTDSNLYVKSTNGVDNEEYFRFSKKLE